MRCAGGGGTLAWGGQPLFFNPARHGLTADPEGTGQTAWTRAFLCNVEDCVLLLGGVGVAAWVFAVLLAAGSVACRLVRECPSGAWL